jgi:GDP-mannose 6-dehydrogenase
MIHLTICVLGLGPVGLVSAACLANRGHRVVGVDRDAEKVRSIKEGRAPFFETGLKDLVSSNVSEGRLSATVSATEGLADADIAFVCVGTPTSESEHDVELGQLRSVVADIVEARAGQSRPLVVAIRSTVFPGTCKDIVIRGLASSPGVSVVSNPEFLREGSAIDDF